MTGNLRKKLFRDLRQNFVQFLAIFVMCFFAMLVLEGFDSDETGDSRSVDEYYRDTDFLDLYAESESFNRQDLLNLKGLPDVADAELRSTVNGKVRLSEEKKVEFNFIQTNNISKMLLSAGENYEEGMSGIWIDRSFAERQGIEIGDALQCVCNDNRFTEVVRGIIDNPEHMYFVIDDTYTEPDLGDYGYAFLDAGEYPGADISYNRIYVDLKTVENQFNLDDHDIAMLDNAKMEIMRALDKTGLTVVTKQWEAGFRAYQGDMEYNDTMGIVFPALFIMIAMLGIMTTMTRLVTRQRTIIGTLKALGFSRQAILIHYISYSFFIALTGSIAGSIAGWWTLGKTLNSSMNRFYTNPYARMEFSMKPVIVTIVIVMMAVMVNYFSCRKLLVQRASDILRPEPPAVVGAGFLEKTFLWKLFDFATKWNMRDINRNRVRTLMGMIGVTLTTALMLSAFGTDEINHTTEGWQYDELTPADYTVTFDPEAGYGVVYDYAKQYDGQMIQSTQAETFHSGQTRLYNISIVDEGNLLRFQNKNKEYVHLSDHEIAISSRVAENYDIKEGDFISFKFPQSKERYSGRVGMIYKAPSNQGLAITRKYAESLGITFAPNMIYTNKTVPGSLEKDRQEVSSVTSKKAFIQSLRAKSAGTDETVTYTMTLAVIIGVVVMYNLGILSFTEKTREIATLKVLGFSTNKIRWILQQQNIIVTGAGTAAGLCLGIKVLELIVGSLDEELDYIFILSPRPYIYAFLLSFVLSLAVNGIISRKVIDIDMVEALKGVE
ncbi:MAG: ABC transporter permease [Lachnospiraceae bacterium]|nr:ABC transporter permease [Lachnospiraceae bacterium]